MYWALAFVNVATTDRSSDSTILLNLEVQPNISFILCLTICKITNLGYESFKKRVRVYCWSRANSANGLVWAALQVSPIGVRKDTLISPGYSITIALYTMDSGRPMTATT